MPFTAFHVPVLHVHQCLINLGFLLYHKKPCCQPVTDCIYCPVLVSYNNWNIIHLTSKSTPFEDFDEIHQIVLDDISDYMASLVQSGKYGVNNIDDTTTNGSYVIEFISKAYTPQINTKLTENYFC